MEVGCSFETLVSVRKTTCCYNPEGYNLRKSGIVGKKEKIALSRAMGT
jgi:hypothetical protein